MTSKSKICIIVKQTIAASAAAAAQERSSVISGAGQGSSGGGRAAAGTVPQLCDPAGSRSLWGRGMGEIRCWETLFLLQRAARTSFSLPTLESTVDHGAFLARI